MESYFYIILVGILIDRLCDSITHVSIRFFPIFYICVSSNVCFRQTLLRRVDFLSLNSLYNKVRLLLGTSLPPSYTSVKQN